MKPPPSLFSGALGALLVTAAVFAAGLPPPARAEV